MGVAVRLLGEFFREGAAMFLNSRSIFLSVVSSGALRGFAKLILLTTKRRRARRVNLARLIFVNFVVLNLHS